MALVTGATRERITITAGAVLPRFDAVVTANDVTRTKPFPDPYLAAASGLRVEPDACVVIENAPLGIDAAHAAGMRCVAVASTLDPRHLSAADIVVANLFEVIPHLESMGAGA
jgi:HAD superfamily hydrolase (TIGR01509 family)